MLVLGKQEHAVIENNMDKGSHDCSGLEAAKPESGLSSYDLHDLTNTVAGQKADEEGYVPPCKTSPGSYSSIRQAKTWLHPRSWACVRELQVSQQT